MDPAIVFVLAPDAAINNVLALTEAALIPRLVRGESHKFLRGQYIAHPPGTVSL